MQLNWPKWYSTLKKGLAVFSKKIKACKDKLTEKLASTMPQKLIILTNLEITPQMVFEYIKNISLIFSVFFMIFSWFFESIFSIPLLPHNPGKPIHFGLHRGVWVKRGSTVFPDPHGCQESGKSIELSSTYALFCLFGNFFLPFAHLLPGSSFFNPTY